MTCKASKRSTHANGRPSLALKAKVEIGTVLYLVPDGIWIPPHAVHQLMAIAFRHGASYVLQRPVTWDEQPLLPAVKWPRDTLIAKPAVRELMETAFLYGAVYALNSVPHGVHLPRIERVDLEETTDDRACPADVVRTLRRSNLRGLLGGKPGRRVC